MTVRNVSLYYVVHEYMHILLTVFSTEIGGREGFPLSFKKLPKKGHFAKLLGVFDCEKVNFLQKGFASHVKEHGEKMSARFASIAYFCISHLKLPLNSESKKELCCCMREAKPNTTYFETMECTDFQNERKVINYGRCMGYGTNCIFIAGLRNDFTIFRRATKFTEIFNFRSLPTMINDLSQRLLFAQRLFVRARVRSKRPTTCYPLKTACIAHLGNYSLEFSQLYTSHSLCR